MAFPPRHHPDVTVVSAREKPVIIRTSPGARCSRLSYCYAPVISRLVNATANEQIHLQSTRGRAPPRCEPSCLPPECSLFGRCLRLHLQIYLPNGTEVGFRPWWTSVQSFLELACFMLSPPSVPTVPLVIHISSDLSAPNPGIVSPLRDAPGRTTTLDSALPLPTSPTLNACCTCISSGSRAH